MDDAETHSTASSRSQPPEKSHPIFGALIFIATIALALFCLRITGPADYDDNAQQDPMAYVMDAVVNHKWIVQHDVWGDIASKPPLMVWLAAGFSVIAGQVNAITLALPSAMAVTGTSILILLAGRNYFSLRAGVISAFVFLISPFSAKLVLLVRTDALFTLLIAGAALAAFRAWTTGRGWTLFWLIGAAATLTKGPLGLALAALGLLAALWEQSSKASALARGSHAPGVILYLAITAGWLALAYRELGPPLLQRLFVRELFTHAVLSGSRKVFGQEFYQAPFFFLTRFAPWSLFTVAALWRAWKTPSTNVIERRFERFLACWFVAGLAIFALAAHQRGDLIFPLIPAAALLAGRAMAHYARNFRPLALRGAAFAVVVLGFAGFYFYYHIARGRNQLVAQTEGMKTLAASIRERVGDCFPFLHVDDPTTLQVCLQSFYPMTSAERAIELLRQSTPAFVVVRDLDRFQKKLGSDDAARFQQVAAWPEQHPFVRILSNYPRLEWPESIATFYGDIAIQAKGIRRLERRNARYEVVCGPGSSSVEFHNEGSKPEIVSVRFQRETHVESQSHLLEPGAIWRMSY